jgi:cytochrome c oxidase subunit 2
MTWLARILAAAPLALTGCSGWQSSLDPHGPAAESISWLFWVFTAVCTVVWLLVAAVLMLALARRHRERPNPLAVDAGQERRVWRVVIGATGLTVVTLLVLTGLSYTGQARRAGASPDTPLSLKLTGHQWWWDVLYEATEPDRNFHTANEIHIPVGEPVQIKLESNDVIHSFWVPNLAGKLDLVPGRQNTLVLTTSRAGTYRGQCAEYCGWQHAHMALLVVAEEKEAFEAWRKAQISARQPPEDDARKQGETVFLTNACVMCHTVRGTDAGGRTGPDLTHLASRQTIAAGTLPLTRGTLAAWIVDPQGIKPGAHMPLVPLAAGDVDPLLSYLEGLR